jgi:hypothetical protein
MEELRVRGGAGGYRYRLGFQASEGVVVEQEKTCLGAGYIFELVLFLCLFSRDGRVHN